MQVIRNSLSNLLTRELQGAGKQYAVAPILGYDKDLSDAFNQLRLQFGGKLSSLQPWAHAATARAALDSLGFSESGKVIATGTPEQGRAGMGLGSAATATLTVSNADGTVGRVLKVGDGGWMGQMEAYFRDIEKCTATHTTRETK